MNRLGEFKFYLERIGTYLGKVSQLMVVYLFWKDVGWPLPLLPVALLLSVWLIKVIDMKWIYPGESGTQLKTNSEWVTFMQEIRTSFQQLQANVNAIAVGSIKNAPEKTRLGNAPSAPPPCKPCVHCGKAVVFSVSMSRWVHKHDGGERCDWTGTTFARPVDYTGRDPLGELVEPGPKRRKKAVRRKKK